jgi:putative two-component system response regulator
VGIPDHILLKPGKFTDDEFAIMQTHTTIGAATLVNVDGLYPGNDFIRFGIDIAENHHEKWNGTGYPGGRAGDRIPLVARIVALADVFDALTSKRCYKEAFSYEKSRQIILEGKGNHFDPDIVDVFVECENEFREIME